MENYDLVVLSHLDIQLNGISAQNCPFKCRHGIFRDALPGVEQAPMGKKPVHKGARLRFSCKTRHDTVKVK